MTAQVFREVNGPALMNGTGLARWRQCIDYPRLDEDVQNVVFENELASQRGSDVVGKVSIIPTIRINGQQYRGTLTSANVMPCALQRVSDGPGAGSVQHGVGERG